MKTVIINWRKNKTMLCVIVFVVLSNGISAQNKLSLVVSKINIEWAIPIVCVFVFASFMFYAFLKQKNH